MNKKVIALCALTSVLGSGFVTTQTAKASVVGRVGRSASNIVRSSVSSISSRISGSSASSISSRISRSSSSSISSRSSRSTVKTSATSVSLSNINARLSNLEKQRSIETRRSKSFMNKAIVISGLVGSGAMVAGVVGGIIQQTKLIDLSNQQSRADQIAQQDLNAKRQELQDKEVPEAVQDIIKYYRDHYGIELKQEN